jgi:adenylate kinase family enzyme
MRLLVGLTGKRGSGKSTIARRLAQRYGFACTSFGDVVRREAIARALLSDMPTLQALGQQLINEWGWTRFCQATLAGTHDSSNVVIDGIRHIHALETLRSLVAPAPLMLVYVQLDETHRVARLRARGRAGDTDPRVENDPVEQEVDSLRALASLTVTGSDESSADSIAQWLHITDGAVK